MNIVMPLMIGYFTIKFPSGIALYWVVGNIFTIIQQYLMKGKALGTRPRRKIDEMR